MSIEVSPTKASRHEPQMFGATSQNQSHPADPAQEVGFFLQREREARGLSIEIASEATGIHPYHIEAIELGDLTHMPPRMEAMEMIAGYGQYLGFEPEPLIEHLLTFLPPPPITPKPFHPAQPHVLSSAKVLSFGKLPKIPSFNIRLANYPGGARGLLSTVSAAMVLMVGAHFALSHEDAAVKPATEQVAAAPEVVAPVVAAPVQATAVATAQADVKVTDQPMKQGDKIAGLTAPANNENDAIGALIKDENQDVVPVAKVKPAKLASTKLQDRIKVDDQLKTASTSPIPSPAPGRVFGADNKDARLVIKALAPVYLRVEDARGIPILAQMLNTGDTYRVPNREGMVALSRDGGRLAYQIDGQDKGVLGPPGKILVGEKLDITALQAKI